MKNLKNFLQKVDNITPNPWYVNGVEQVRPTTQLGFLFGLVVGIIIFYCLF